MDQHRSTSLSPQQSRQLSHYAKNRREKETTEPPPCVIYPKRGKGNAQSKPGKRRGLATKENGIGSRLCEGKVLAPLRIRRTRRDPRSERIEERLLKKLLKTAHNWKETQMEDGRRTRLGFTTLCLHISYKVMRQIRVNVVRDRGKRAR